jgi:hypothetical protein
VSLPNGRWAFSDSLVVIPNAWQPQSHLKKAQNSPTKIWSFSKSISFGVIIVKLC